MSRGSLIVVGTGIKIPAQTSAEAVSAIQAADLVFYLAADPLTAPWLRGLSGHIESLDGFYEWGVDRSVSYERMVERVLESVRAGRRVCFVAYGHPGVFAYPTHEAVRRARSEGFEASMQPGISAEDCLFADIGFDPGTTGCQSFEATDFLVYARAFDPRSALVLWQIGAIACRSIASEKTAWNPEGVAVLTETLLSAYGAEHEVIVYEAPRYAVVQASIVRTPLSELPRVRIATLSTLFVPPKPAGAPDAAMLGRLGLDASMLSAATIAPNIASAHKRE